MSASLSECLREYAPIMLKAIADGWRVPLTDEQLPEIVDRLVMEMTSPQNVEAVIGRLGDAEREALASVAARGQIRAHVLTRRYGQIRRLGPGQLEWEQAWHEPASAVERLWFLGLIHRRYGLDEHYHGEVFFIPAEIRAVLPPLPAPLAEFKVAIVDEPAAVRDDQNALARDAFVFLSHLRSQDVRGTKGLLARGVLSKMHRRLSDMDPQRLALLHHLCERATLLRRNDDGRWQPTSEAAGWLKADDLARRRILYQTWLEDTVWNDLWMVPALRCEDTGWRNDPVLARKAILAWLGKCPVGTWLSIESLQESIHNVDPDFMRPDGDYESWYIRDAETEHYLTGFGSWDKVEGALIAYTLERPLLWLGVVAVGCPEGAETADRFKITPEGSTVSRPDAAILEPAVPSPGEARFAIQPGAHILVPIAASWYDRFLLERFARWQSEQGGEARYAVDANSLRAALAGGITVRQILAFLRRVSGERVPKEMVRALRSWSGGGRSSS